MNRSDLRKRVKVLLRDPVTDPASESNLISNTDLNAILNERRFELHAHLSTLFPQRFAAATTQTYAASSSVEALTAACQNTKILSIRARTSAQTVPYEYVNLRIISLQEAMGYDRNGPPTFAAIEAMTNIRLRPVPDVAYTLEIIYVPALSEMDDDADSPSELPAAFHHVIAYAAAIQIKNMSEDPVGGLDAAYQAALSRLVAYMADLVDDQGLEGVS